MHVHAICTRHLHTNAVTKTSYGFFAKIILCMYLLYGLGKQHVNTSLVWDKTRHTWRFGWFGINYLASLRRFRQISLQVCLVYPVLNLFSCVVFQGLLGRRCHRCISSKFRYFSLLKVIGLLINISLSGPRLSLVYNFPFLFAWFL